MSHNLVRTSPFYTSRLFLENSAQKILRALDFPMFSTQGGHGSVRLRFVHGTVRAVPAFGSDGSYGERASEGISVEF